ncbi:hypothetical protein TRVL_08704 [Trypanosoma vivax]|nr:hypothetical protein TRVL_08704 [Trypanosoma vivax]
MAMSVIERVRCAVGVEYPMYVHTSIGVFLLPAVVVFFPALLSLLPWRVRAFHTRMQDTDAATSGSALSRPRPLCSLPLHSCVCWGVLKLVERAKRQCDQCCASSLPPACLHKVSGTHRVTSLAVSAV